MSAPETVINFNDLDGLRTEVLDAREISDDTWWALQDAHNTSLQARLPLDEWGRAHLAASTHSNFSYRRSRIDPDLLVGNSWVENQLFKDSQIAVVSNAANEVVGGVVTANNTSVNPGLPGLLQPLMLRAKMYTPPGLHMPVVGGKKYVHIREAYVRPDAQTPLDIRNREGINEVSGIVLLGLWHSLRKRHENQQAAAYVIPKDPMDGELTGIVQVLGMQQTGHRPCTLPGFKENAQLVRVQSRVGDLLARIGNLLDQHVSVE